MASEAQIAANRANAQRSTGPKTEEGKARVAQNGLKHGLCAKSAVLPGEERAGYEALLADLVALWRPTNGPELALVEEYAGCIWRLRRSCLVETGLLAVAWPRKMQEMVDERSPDGTVMDLAMETWGLGLAFSKAGKDLARLSLQESRVVRQRERVRKELEALQARRKQAEAELASDSQAAAAPADAAADGTEADAPRPTPQPPASAAPRPEETVPPLQESQRNQELARELALHFRAAA